MKESVTIELELEGSLAKQGFSVSMRGEKEIAENEIVKGCKKGHLPAHPGILDLFGKWQEAFENQVVLVRRKGDKAETFSYKNSTAESAEALKENFNNWWNAGDDKEWKRVHQKILTWATRPNKEEVTPIIVHADDCKLWQLPWSALKLSEEEDIKVEFVFSLPEQESRSRQPKSTKVKILAVLGEKDNSETPGWFRKLWQNLRGFLNLRGLGNLIPPLVDSSHQKKDNSGKIDVRFDRAVLEKFTPGAEITFLEGPSREELLDHLINDKWHIFFFAGHSSTDEKGNIGKFQVNEESLTIEELKHHFEIAIKNGLQLAIFNSCDGVGLAKQLAELYLPQSIVMRLPVPDKVAQEFLKLFLKHFVKQGKSLYAAVYETRGLLKEKFRQYPGVGWLPMICQNPGVGAGSWEEWTQASKKFRSLLFIGTLLLALLPVIGYVYPMLWDLFWLESVRVKTSYTYEVYDGYSVNGGTPEYQPKWKDLRTTGSPLSLYKGDFYKIQYTPIDDSYIYVYLWSDGGEVYDHVSRYNMGHQVEGMQDKSIPPADSQNGLGFPSSKNEIFGTTEICVLAFKKTNPYLDNLVVDRGGIGKVMGNSQFQYYLFQYFWGIKYYLNMHCPKKNKVTFEMEGDRS